MRLSTFVKMSTDMLRSFKSVRVSPSWNPPGPSQEFMGFSTLKIQEETSTYHKIWNVDVSQYKCFNNAMFFHFFSGMHRERKPSGPSFDSLEEDHHHKPSSPHKSNQAMKASNSLEDRGKSIGSYNPGRVLWRVGVWAKWSVIW